jgi:hypothetical protein
MSVGAVDHHLDRQRAGHLSVLAARVWRVMSAKSPRSSRAPRAG